MNNKLSYKIISQILFIIIFSFGFLGYYAYNIQINLNNKKLVAVENLMEQEHKDQEKLSISYVDKSLQTNINNLIYAVSSVVYYIDMDATEDILKYFIKNDSVYAIRIFGEDSDNDFVSIIKKSNGIDFVNKIPESYNKYAKIKEKLKYKGTDFGNIEIFYSTDKILNNIKKVKEKSTLELKEYSKEEIKTFQNAIEKQIIMFLIIILITFFILFLIINKNVVIPILKINKGLKSFFTYLRDDDEAIKVIKIDTKDELGQMAEFINDSVKISVKNSKEYNDLFKIVDENIITSQTDINGIITKVSKAFCFISGYTQNELIGSSHSIVNHVDMPDEIFKDMWETITKNNIWYGEIKNMKKDGSFYWLSTTITPLYFDNGTIYGYHAIRNDITHRKEIESIKTEIEHLNKKTKASIEYASLLQEALLPEDEALESFFTNYFIYWNPKDTVGGDIYLFNTFNNDNECLLFIIDCTGHGVSGAFVTMIVKTIQREIVKKIQNNENETRSPALIMSYFNKSMKDLLKQNNENSKSNAGWDGSIIYYNKKLKKLKYAGAESFLFYIDKSNTLVTLKGNRYSVGYKKCDYDYEYSETEIDVYRGMKFYCTTDGYIDQNGGEFDFPFGKRKFENLIKENYDKPMSMQKDIFVNAITKYQNQIENCERNDDIALIGFEL